ncbi:hypothetical protein CBQ28_09250 [Pseudoalteromonas sp. GCY]|uniref:hypothetical protein n=1 Tax=Pseudoalteromonas sp. GCY TaxID=2003316 RepID=UPI000BFEFB63|nr:hypothetical protein [Pseudoalteromonas sp. GCY]PHI37540.1 hypothetical protein CBQ28_09250 [Pseudoalteromonas sp. GCY]QQQ65514.1 hypothetical protein JJQ94_03840 [Pseudoalteromonas sp. GCY]
MKTKFFDITLVLKALMLTVAIGIFFNAKAWGDNSPQLLRDSAVSDVQAPLENPDYDKTSTSRYSKKRFKFTVGDVSRYLPTGITKGILQLTNNVGTSNKVRYRLQAC